MRSRPASAARCERVARCDRLFVLRVRGESHRARNDRMPRGGRRTVSHGSCRLIGPRGAVRDVAGRPLSRWRKTAESPRPVQLLSPARRAMSLKGRRVAPGGRFVVLVKFALPRQPVIDPVSVRVTKRYGMWAEARRYSTLML